MPPHTERTGGGAGGPPPALFSGRAIARRRATGASLDGPVCRLVGEAQVMVEPPRVFQGQLSPVRRVAQAGPRPGATPPKRPCRSAWAPGWRAALRGE